MMHGDCHLLSIGAWVQNGHKRKEKKGHIHTLSLSYKHTRTHQKEIDSVLFFTVFLSSNSTTAVQCCIKAKEPGARTVDVTFKITF